MRLRRMAKTREGSILRQKCRFYCIAPATNFELCEVAAARGVCKRQAPSSTSITVTIIATITVLLLLAAALAPVLVLEMVLVRVV